jgi:sugar transferase (PEP-CTERM/EpsH1 system associated)
MKLFIITSRVPYPLDKGDKLRAYHQLKFLAQHHEVMLCCLDEQHVQQKYIDELKKMCKVTVFKLPRWVILCNLFLALFSDKPYQIHYFFNPFVKKKVRELIQQFKPDHIYCQLIRSAEYVKDIHEIPKTLDYMDTFSKGMERRIALSHGFLKPLVKAEYKRLLKYENLIFDYFENKTIISEQDRELIYHKDRNRIHIIKNGVDMDYFTPSHTTEKIYHLAFVGNLNYPPNIFAAEYLVNEVMPLLPPSIKLIIAGANPSKKIMALQSTNIAVSSWVEDIRSIYNSATIFVAPMFIGTGLQNKLLEAMAMKLPCITTSLANNALKAEPNKEILIANTAKECATSILSLLENKTLQNIISQAGFEFIKHNYSWQAQNELLNNIFDKKT